MKKEFLVNNLQNKEKIRLDQFLVDKTNLSKTKVQDLIKANLVFVNNDFVTKNGFWLVNKDFVKITEKKEEVVILDEIKSTNNYALDIVYEDDYLLVINKPSGLLTHPTSHNEPETLNSAVNLYLNKDNLNENIARGGIAHRLDRETSGLILVAKTQDVLKILLNDFAEQKIVKKYFAVVCGHLPKKHVVINLPIGRASNGTLKMTIKAKKNNKISKTEVKENLKLNEHSFVECILHTGRTHQIRIHLSSIGCPVYNDYLYGKKILDDNFGQYLHAYYLGFNHPVKNEWVEFKLELPREFKQKLEELKN